MASLRNLAIGALRLAGHASIAAALRHNGRDLPVRSSSSAWQPHENDSTSFAGAPGVDMQPAGCPSYMQPADCI